MSNRKSLLVLLVLISLLFGCNVDVEKTQSNLENNRVDFMMLTSEKTLPINFDDIAFKRDTTPLQQFLVRKSVNQSEFDEYWKLYGFEQQAISNVDFNEHIVFFIGILESGSCPSEIKDVEFNTDNHTMTIPLSQLEGDCTTDATPKTFVIQLEKELSEKIKNLNIIQSNTKTNVPFE